MSLSSFSPVSMLEISDTISHKNVPLTKVHLIIIIMIIIIIILIMIMIIIIIIITLCLNGFSHY